MSLHEYLRAVRKRWWAVLITVVLGVGGAVGLLLTTTPLYRSEITFYVSTGPVAGSDSSGSAFSADQFARTRATSYAELVSSDRVAAVVANSQSDVDLSASDIAKEITGTVDVDTVLLRVAVTDPDADRALLIAQTLGSTFNQVVQQLDEGLATTVTLTVVSGPTNPGGPVSPRPSLYVLAGLLAGVVVGLFLAVLRERLDTTIRSDQSLALVSDLPILGSVPEDSAARTTPLVWGDRSTSPRAEVYRRLRTNLQFVDVDNPLKTVLVTSAMPDEGKSLTAVNLGLSFADAGVRTVLIEADLRRPRVSSYLEVDNSVGLTNVLAGLADLDHVVYPWSTARFYLLPSGPTVPNPAEALGSKMMADVVARLRARFDLVIIDAPPVLPVTDAAVLASVSDGVLFIVRAGQTKRAQLAASLRSLAAVDADVAGFVLNRRPAKRGATYGTYGNYGTYGSTNDFTDAVDVNRDPQSTRARSRMREPATREGLQSARPEDSQPVRSEEPQP